MSENRWDRRIINEWQGRASWQRVRRLSLWGIPWMLMAALVLAGCIEVAGIITGDQVVVEIRSAPPAPLPSPTSPRPPNAPAYAGAREGTGSSAAPGHVPGLPNVGHPAGR